MDPFHPFGKIKESFAARIFALFCALIIVSVLSFGGFYLADQRKLFRDNLVKEGTYLARNLAYNARVGVFTENERFLKDPLGGVAQYDGVVSVAVFTRDGRLLKEERGGARSLAAVPPAGEETKSLGSFVSPVWREHDGTMEFWAPIVLEAGSFSEEDLYFGKSARSSKDRTIGLARVVVDKGVYDRKFAAIFCKIATLGFVFILVGGLTTYLLVRGATRPLGRLMQGVRGVQGGGFERVQVETTDEIGRVAVAFNRMVDSLERREAERNQAPEEVRSLNADLERRVWERTAALEEANAELESFNYSVSHDLRAPIVRIEGFCNALAEDCGDRMDALGEFYLERIQSTCGHMDQIVKAMMSLSLVNRGESRRERINLSGLVETIVAGLREQAPERGVEVVVKPDVYAEGDARLVSVMLENIVGNAWKFTAGRPEPLIEFGIRPVRERNVFYLRDNGSGFDMTYASRLFRPFERLHSSDRFPGTGVGLAIVSKIVDRHDGAIWLESEEGKGTTVFFTLSPGLVP